MCKLDNLVIFWFNKFPNVPICVKHCTRFWSLVDLYMCQAVQLHGRGLFKGSSNEECNEDPSYSLCSSLWCGCSTCLVLLEPQDKDSALCAKCLTSLGSRCISWRRVSWDVSAGVGGGCLCCTCMLPADVSCGQRWVWCPKELMVLMQMQLLRVDSVPVVTQSSSWLMIPLPTFYFQFP